MISILFDILSLFNAAALLIVMIGFLVSLIDFIDIAKILYTVGVKGYGLPKVALYSFISVIFLLIAFILMIFQLTGWLELRGLALLFIMLSTLINYYSIRVLRSILNELLYA